MTCSIQVLRDGARAAAQEAGFCAADQARPRLGRLLATAVPPRPQARHVTRGPAVQSYISCVVRGVIDTELQAQSVVG